MKGEMIVLPQLTLDEKWHTAESNLVYFIVCGIAYGKAKGETPEDFGTFAGTVAYWEEEKGKGPRILIDGISRNKQQFSDFQMDILNVSDKVIEARMRGFGENHVRNRKRHDITVDEYIRFFGKKWEAIANQLGLVYRQRADGDWILITVAEQ